MSDLITSPSNPRVKQVRALRQRKHRDESGLFIVEGIHPVGEAAAAGRLAWLCYAPELLASLYARELVEREAARGVPCHAMSGEVFTSLADRENPAGLLAVARQHWHTLADLSPAGFPWGVALVSPQDPGNVGTILRTIDAVSASGLLLLDSSVDAHHPSAVRASMGTLLHLPLARASFSEFTAWARGHGYQVVGTSARGSVDYRSVPAYPRPAMLLLGSERAGLSAEQRAACDVLVRLPMHGRTSSLNLAVAAGVMLYAMEGRP